MAFPAICFMLEIEPYKQSAPGYCGPACLKMVLQYFGIEKSEEELSELAECNPRRGTSGERLLEAAQFYGLEGIIKDNATLGDLREIVSEKKVPLIVDWFSYQLDRHYSVIKDNVDGHYSIVVDVDVSYVHIIDPSFGELHSIRRGTFRRLWFDFPGDYLKRPEEIILRRMIVLFPKERMKEFENV